MATATSAYDVHVLMDQDLLPTCSNSVILLITCANANIIQESNYNVSDVLNEVSALN